MNDSTNFKNLSLAVAHGQTSTVHPGRFCVSHPARVYNFHFMKKIILISWALVPAYSVSWAQSDTSAMAKVTGLTAYNVRTQPAKDDNTIIVHGVTFQQAVNKLLDMNFVINHVDKDFQIAETEPDEWSQLIFIRVNSDGDLVIRSQLIILHNRSDVYYSTHGYIGARWKALMAYASSFSNLEYKKL